MGRILTRAQEAHWAADTMQVFFDKLITNLKNGDSTAVFTNKWDPDTWPQEARGVGFTEAPRRRARALDGHQKQKGGRLPVCRPYHMERRTA